MEVGQLGAPGILDLALMELSHGTGPAPTRPLHTAAPTVWGPQQRPGPVQWTAAGLSGPPGAAAVGETRPGSRPAPTQRHSTVERTARDQFLQRPGAAATLTSVCGWLEETTLPMEMCLQ